MMPVYTDEQISLAIYTVNKHAKTAPDNKPLYALKRAAIEQLLKEKRANKVGLHFVKNPRFSQQQSSVLISCADYYFHTLPVKSDFQTLPHLGQLDEQYRNPIRKMSLRTAKEILQNYTKPLLPKQQNDKKEPPPTKPKKKIPYIKNTSYFAGY